MRVIILATITIDVSSGAERVNVVSAVKKHLAYLFNDGPKPHISVTAQPTHHINPEDLQDVV